jgi:small subunit ribosomal protein S4
VYRAGFVKTRRAARQLVSHGHIMVNNRRMNIPSFRVSVGDVVSVREASRGSTLFTNRNEANIEHKAPGWLTVSQDGFFAELVKDPEFAQSELTWNPSTIIQFYSR